MAVWIISSWLLGGHQTRCSATTGSFSLYLMSSDTRVKTADVAEANLDAQKGHGPNCSSSKSGVHRFP